MKAHVDVGLQREVYHALQVTILDGLRALELTALALVQDRDRFVAELRRAGEGTAGVGKQRYPVRVRDLL